MKHFNQYINLTHILFSLIIVAIIITGCGIFSKPIADIAIQDFNSNGSILSFTVKIIPDQTEIIFGDIYSIVLESHDGYIFDHEEVSWLSFEFEMRTPVNNRDINAQIEATRVRGVRKITMTASQMDKDIYPMLKELGSLQTEMNNKKEQDVIDAWEAWIQNGELISVDPNKYNITESDYQRIANKYVKIVIMPYEEYLRENGQPALESSKEVKSK